ncbi:hypothetical protein [Halobacterium bonnevillei]|jgi:hypothetical protein|uniref:Uncharacterized protein n=1 Tax=Halobacterium bonnevillei TaxID=2692200 RepID=A0A6B0SRF1_9EURY|nr:hypothetical protein [Halobacterium bonnevillei]MXR22121.1 hypothetical protein [Halobacterium bonnevillei]
MSTVRYRLVSELARPGEQFDVPEDVDPVVEPCERQGYVRVTYLKPVTAVPIEDDADPAYLR